MRLWIFFLILMFPSPRAMANSLADELYTAADQAFHNGYADVAERYCENFLAQYPNHPQSEDVRFLLGQSYFLREKFQDALLVFLSLKDAKNHQDGVGFWLGEVYTKLREPKKAETQYLDVINRFPSSAFTVQAMYSLGWLYLDKKEFLKAQEILGKLVAVYPTNPLAEDARLKLSECALSLSDWKRAVDLLKDYIQQYPQSIHADDVWFNLGEAYYNQNNFTQAIEAYKKVIQSSGKDHALKLSAYIGQGWSLVKLNKPLEAANLTKTIKDFAKAHKLYTDDLLLTLGNILLEAGESKSALGHLNELIAVFPASILLEQAFLSRANVYFSLKDYEQAQQDYERLLNSRNEDVSQKAYFGLGWVLQKRGRFNKAVSCFKAVAVQAKDPLIKANALIQIADGYQDAEQISQAISEYQQILAQMPDLTKKDYVMSRLIAAFLKNDQPDLALASLEELTKNFPQSVYATDGDYYAGVAHYKKGQWDLAVRAMQDFLRGLTKPSDFTPQANYILAISLLNLKQTDEALKIFQKILRLYPDNHAVAINADLGIARCYVDLNQRQEARKRFKLIAYKYPSTDASFEALMWLAKDELKNNNPQQAVRYYQQLVEGFSSHPLIESVYYEIAQAYEILAKTDQALAFYGKIHGDEELTIKAKLAIAQLTASDVDVNQAIALYLAIMKEYPSVKRFAAVKLGQVYRNMGQYEKEQQIYQEALKAPLGNPQISQAQLQFNMADTLEMMSRTDEAIEGYLSVEDHDPEEKIWKVKALLRVARIYEDGQDWQRARLTYQQVIALNVEESKYAQERLDGLKNNMTRKR